MAKTKVTVKSGKKPPAKKTSLKANPEWETLAKELRSLIPKLDEEGLAFLVEQAHVHLYNQQVDALNETLIKSQQRAEAKRNTVKNSGKGSVNASSVNVNNQGGFNDIKVSESGSSYYIVYKTEWIMFSKEEMVKLIKIAKGQGTDLEIKERLFNWFARERTDLLRSSGIADKFDNKLKSLAVLIRKKF